jgi:acyl-CoA dehydrogenase family protein 9
MIREAALHATQRRQFNARIADFEMIRGKFARMVANTYALESLVYMTAGLVDRGLSDYALEGAACKVFGTETVWSIINDALQIAGGNGFMEEYPYERALRDSRVNMIFEGTNEILRVLLALSGLREVGADLEEVARALKTPLSNLGILSDYVGRKIRGYVGRERIESIVPELAVEAELVMRYTRFFGTASEAFLSRFGKHVIERQYQQERLANVALDLYASLAVLSRATSAVRRLGGDRASDEVRLARAFVQAAKYRIVGELKEIDKNRDRERADARDAERTAIAETAYSSPGYRFDLWV